MSLFQRFVTEADLVCPSWLNLTTFEAIVEATKEAFSILEEFLKKPQLERVKTAITFDIDDTVCYSETKEPILPIQALYRAIKEIARPHMAIFFISSRPWCYRNRAKEQLRVNGYDTWNKTYFVDHIRPTEKCRLSVTGLGQDDPKFTPFDWCTPTDTPDDDPTGKGRRKADVRRLLEEKGYTILMNIGDEPTDHMYGHYQHSIRLPSL